jgi:hypothetical protein
MASRGHRRLTATLCGYLWVVVRRAGGRTLWRTIQLAPVRSAALGLLQSLWAATELEEVIMTRDEVFPSRYLKAADLKGKPRTVTIESAPYETLKSLDGKETHKIVLYFKNAEKALPLNATNFDAVCNATGCPDTEDWPGQRIELYPTRTTMGGKAGGLHPHPSAFHFKAGGSGTIAATSVRACK